MRGLLNIALCLVLLGSFSMLPAQYGLPDTLAPQAAPDTLLLYNVDSAEVRLADFKDKKALVLIFTSNHCVYSKKYEDRVMQTATDYIAKGFAFALVNSNSPELSQEDRFDIMRQRAEEKKYPCPYLQDPGSRLAIALGVRKNPAAFVMIWKDGKPEIVYSGKIDDNPLMESRVEHHYLREVLEKINAGEMDAVEPVPAVGCPIKRLD